MEKGFECVYNHYNHYVCNQPGKALQERWQVADDTALLRTGKIVANREELQKNIMNLEEIQWWWMQKK